MAGAVLVSAAEMKADRYRHHLGATDTFTFLAVQYFGVRYLEAFVCILISTMTLCFFVNWGLSGGSDLGNTEYGSGQTEFGLLAGWALPTVQSWGVTQVPLLPTRRTLPCAQGTASARESAAGRVLTPNAATIAGCGNHRCRHHAAQPLPALGARTLAQDLPQ